MYPVMLDLTKKKAVVIGGGRIALRKVQGLLAAGSKPVVVAPELHPELEALAEVVLVKECYRRDHLQGAHLVFACTDSLRVNQQIVVDCDAWQWVNDCSQKENSDFFNMAVLPHEDGLIALSSLGRSPAETKQLKERLHHFLQQE